MLRQSLAIVQILSLDVVLGAVVSSMFVAKYLGLTIPLPWLSALAIAVWLIYTADHLVDAKKIKHNAHTARHRYHQRYFKSISLAWFIIAFLGLYNLFYLPVELVLWGAALSGLVGLYLLLIRLLSDTRFFHKEFVIAFLYVSGIFLAPLYRYNDVPSLLTFIFFSQYFLLALTNVLLISFYEKDTDRTDGHRSFVLVAGDRATLLIIRICLALLYSSALLGVIFFTSVTKFFYLQPLLLLMGATLHLLVLKHSYFSKNKSHRLWADAIFYYPILYLLIY